jgi:cytochrome c-type biogenesis protein CcmH
MIIIFYSLLGLMILVALAFVFVPLLKKSPLDPPFKKGGNTTTPPFEKGGLGGIYWKLALIILLPIFSISLYVYQGSDKQYVSYLQEQQQLAQAQKLRGQLGTTKQIIDKLKQRLQQDPNSAQGWYLLGRIYFDQQQFTQAVAAFSKAYALQPKQPEVLFYYAESLYLTQHSLAGKPQQLLRELLKLQPDNDAAINLLAIAAFNAHHYQEAVTYWEKILPHYSAGSPESKAILNALAKAQKKLAQQDHQE